MTLETIGRRIGGWQATNPWIFIIIGMLITVATVPGLPNLITNVEPSIEKVLPQEVEVVQTMNTMRAQYGADMMYLVIEPDPSAATVTDLRQREAIVYQDMLAQKLIERENILEVRTLADMVKRDGHIPEDQEAIDAAIAANPNSQLFIDEEFSVGVMQIRSDTGASASLIRTTVDAVNEDIASMTEHNPGVVIRLTGFNAIDKATFEIIMSDFQKITGYSFVLMLVFLYFYFQKNMKNVILTMSIIMIALAWTLGITGYLGITITVVTMVAAAMIMALGVDYGVHAVHRYEELKKYGTKEAIMTLQEELLRAFLGSALTTSAGFLALLFGVLPAMKNLGIILAIGIMITMATTIFIVPALILLTESGRSQEKIKKIKKARR